MKVYNFFLIAILTNMLQVSVAQQTGRMETDRPDQTESPFIVKSKYFQTEIGFNLEKNNGFRSFVIPTILWKYGLLKKLELRFITEINAIETPLIIPDGSEVNSGLVPLVAGGKWSLWEEKGLFPKTSLLFHLAIPKAASKKFKSARWAPAFRFSMEHTLSEIISIGYNIGAEWDGESKTPFWIYTLAQGFNIGKRWYSYMEIFGTFRNTDLPQHNFDAGIGYYINDNVKLDLSSGFDITKNADQHYFAIGVSFRFH
jgi:hypothetical protein